jgi:scyllo-inositol 2-dehydrogenase (NADP+)
VADAKPTKKVVVGNPAFDVGGLAGTEIKNPIRCGVIGLGRIGWEHHSKIMQQHNGFKLVAVCDLEDSRIAEAKAATGCAGYKCFEELLKDKNVELVVVATQSKDHERMAIAASKAGKHVLVEKPSSDSAKGIDRMIAAAKKAKRLLTMHHNYRLNPEYLVTREVIESGKLGEVFRIKRTVNGFARRNDWQTLKKYGGGMTGNWGVHLVDAGLQLMDPKISFVWASIKHIINPGDAEDDIKAIIQDRKGVVLDIDMTSADASKRPTWIVNGTCGTFWMADNKGYIKYFDPKKIRKLKPIDLHLALERKYGVQPGPDVIPWQEEEFEIKPAKQYESYYDNLYLAVRKGKKLMVEPESARRTYDVLDRMKKSAGWK